MIHRLSRLQVVVPLVCLLAFALGATQGKYRDGAAAGPWQVVVSKPVVLPGHAAGRTYSEHEYLSAMMNDLERDGLVPVFTQFHPDQAAGRLLVFCQSK